MTTKQIYELFKVHRLISTDSRKIEKNSIFFALRGKSFDGNKYAKKAIEEGASFAIVDDKTVADNNRIILVNNTLKALQDLATYHRKHLQTKIIAITGTNGKTTTKELIGRVLQTTYNTLITKGNLNNHIGVPLTLLSITKKTEIAVIEMGANHQYEIDFLCKIAQPDFGIITNIGRAHLEGFGSINGVIKTKTELFDYLRLNNGTVFVNTENEIIRTHSVGLNKISYGKTSNDFCQGMQLDSDEFVALNWKTENLSPKYQKTTSQLFGNYNYENILAAICIGAYFGVKIKQINKAISEYSPTNNRSQKLNTKSNTIFLDAYNANPMSMKAALTNFAEMKFKTKIVCLGDMLELGDESEKEHAKILHYLHKSDFASVFLVGKLFADATKTDKKDATYRTFTNTTELLNFLKSNKPKNAHILIKASRGIGLEKIVQTL